MELLGLTTMLADLDASTIWVVIPVTALMIPILAIITGHRRQIAMIKYNRPTNNPDELMALRREVQELKEMVHTQMLAMDSYSKAMPAPSTADPVQDRISANR